MNKYNKILKSNNNLTYHKAGSASSVLIMFHGFGQDHRIYQALIGEVERTHTVYAFDLYYHGQSTRPDSFLRPSEWFKDFFLFLEQEKIDRFSLLGYSLGGRFVIQTIMQFNKKVEAAYLLAPDGLHQSFWYRLANSLLGNQIFKYLMFRDGRFDQFLDIVERTGLVNPALIKFSRLELNEREKRIKVYRVWTYFRLLQVKPKEFLSKVESAEIPVKVILGKADAIVRPQDIMALIQTSENVEIVIIDAKHHKVIERAQSLITTLLSGEIS